MNHAFAALALLAACTTLDAPELEPIAARPLPGDPGDPTCPTWSCGANSATVGDGLIFDALDRTGAEANRGGVKLMGAVAADGQPVALTVVGDNLQGIGAVDGFVYQGDDLIGTVFTLNHPLNGDYEVLITNFNYNDLHFWAGAYEPVRFYEMKTRHASVGKFDEFACRDPLTADPLWAGAPHSAVVFEGDIYDPELKQVAVVAGTPWFNIACAATAPAKMHLMRHTTASSFDFSGNEYFTDGHARTALLKMYTADYCGNGHAFTVDGVRLAYQDANHWKATMEPYFRVEALWTETGAMCLTKPRYVDSSLVQSFCSIPSCTTADLADWENHAHAFSAR